MAGAAPAARRRARRASRLVIEHGDVRIEIVHPGDDAGLGLVRHCDFRVPRYLGSGGVGRSWEVITESRPQRVLAVRGGGQAAVVQGQRVAPPRRPRRRAAPG